VCLLGGDYCAPGATMRLTGLNPQRSKVRTTSDVAKVVLPMMRNSSHEQCVVGTGSAGLV
jgi:hypothetical protein